MTASTVRLGERIIPEKFESKEEYLIYLRHLFAYEFAKDKIPENSFVLEVGCGEGYGTIVLLRRAAKVVALDVDKDVIAHASKKYRSENCVFQVYDGLRIPYKDDIFDAVVSFQVIEHIEDDVNYVSEIHRALKRNGIFILTTPNRTYRLKNGQKPWNRFHLREYYPDELEKILKSKFQDVKVWGIRGNEEVQEIEIKRVKQNLGMLFSSPLNLTRVLAERLKKTGIRILANITHTDKISKADRGFISKYSLKDFYVIKNNVRDSLDLLGICKK